MPETEKKKEIVVACEAEVVSSDKSDIVPVKSISDLSDIELKEYLDDQVETAVIIAKSPEEMRSQQVEIIARCKKNLAKLDVERSDYVKNIEITKKRRHSVKAWETLLKKTDSLISYYKKVQKALELGYYIIPDFPAETFAIRTARKNPRKFKDKWSGSNRTQQSEGAPIGKGKYVSPDPIEKRSINYRLEEDHSGEMVRVYDYFASSFSDHLDFPVKVVKPQILEATYDAMKHSVFDEVAVMSPAGTARNKADPIVIGKVYDPRSPAYERRNMAFVIAWWLDLDSI